MVKILGKVNVKRTKRIHLYSIHRKNRLNSFDKVILSDYGRSQLKYAQKTCDMLNSSEENSYIDSKKYPCKRYYFSPVHSHIK